MICIHAIRHAVGGCMGKRGVGTLLVVGSERDMGGRYVVLLSDLYTFPPWKTFVTP